MVGGDVFLCCPGWLKKPIGNLKDSTLEELWANEIAKEIRESMHDGSFKFCDETLCPHLQALDTGRPRAVYSPIENRELPSSSYAETLMSKVEGSVPIGPREISVAFDPTCNLSCPSCRRKPIVYHTKTDEWAAANKMADEVIKAYPHLRRLKLAGNGDPFASPLYGKMLDAIDAKKHPQLRVMLHTNALLLTPTRWRELEKAWECIDTIEVSVEAGTAETYAINRRGGSFETLLERLEFIGELRQKQIMKRFLVSCVVQENNFREFKSYVELGRRVHADVIVFSRLNDWGTYSYSSLLQRSIHRPDHPAHQEFLEAINDPELQGPDLFFGNLSEFRR